MSVQSRRSNARLPPEVNRVQYVRNLPLLISPKNSMTFLASTERYDRFVWALIMTPEGQHLLSMKTFTMLRTQWTIYQVSMSVDGILLFFINSINKMQQRKSAAVDFDKQKQELQDLEV
ncbi:unnamed protein product [Peronospora belbahrii]|uniref:Uncharacterized protein n=1 Tax=Peronospora belbahrii TaxID=622444 RepID=A0ABN8CQ19_9STRA|nr:unnamed protein product [Peronospora belbahrii]